MQVSRGKRQKKFRRTKYRYGGKSKIESGVYVILRLRVPKLMVFAGFIGKERFVAAFLHDPAVIKYGDGIAEPAGGKLSQHPLFHIYVRHAFILCRRLVGFRKPQFSVKALRLDLCAETDLFST